MSKVAGWRLCATWLAGIPVLGCHQAPPPAPIRIGVLPYSTSSLGTDMTRGAKLAAGELEAAEPLVLDGKRRRLEFSILEIQDNPEAAVTATYRLVNQEEVVAIVGPHYSREAIPAGGVAERARIPMICPASTHLATTAGRRYVFRIPFSDLRQATTLARFARSELGLRKAAVLYEASDPHPQGLAELFGTAFEAEGGTLVASETYTADSSRDFVGQLRRIRREHPDVLFLPGEAQVASVQASQARRLGIQAVLLGSDMWRRPERFGPEFEGAFFAYPKETKGARFETFAAAYERTYGHRPTREAAHSYDAVSLIVAAIRHAGRADAESICRGLLAMDSYRGATGTIRYRGGGDPARAVVIFAVRDGDAVVRTEVPPG
jgi:branched-chain amino acid transport system substrate-binding protein